jgi:enamine deaminase RidA (YjgF/YER057c/UK114 family)
MRYFALILCLAVTGALAAGPGGKKDQEEATQVLALPVELPAATVADADRLVFEVTPLQGAGLLSQQLREAMKWLLHQDRPLVWLRAFVAGTGDPRRVQAVVSEVCAEKRVPLPALSVVQAGDLPRNGAQVVIEAVTSDRKPVNPNGVVFVSARSDYVDQPIRPVLPHLDKVLAGLRKAFADASVAPGDVLQVTCYPTTLDEIASLRSALAAVFPATSFNFVQPLRAALDSGVSCEGVGRAAAPSQARPDRLVFTGTQLAFGTTPADAKLAFERLGKTLARTGASYAHVIDAHIYSLSRATSELAESAGREFFGPSGPPALTALPFEALPSIDASFALDAVAVLPASE